MSLSPAQLKYLEDIGEQSYTKPEPESQKFRTTMQGATLGFADEIESFARSMVDTRPYEEIRDEIRAKVNAYKEANPTEALSLELLGSVAPTAAAFLVGGPVGGTAKTASMWQKAKPVMKIGAIEGMGAAYGTGEKGAVEDLARVPFGGLVGATVAGATTPLMHGGGVVVDKLIGKARQLFGDKGSDVVMTEIQRLAESTGRTPDEIVEAISKGEIMAENATLEATMRAYKSEMGETGAKISEALPRRREQTRDIAMTDIQSELAPGTGTDNVYKAVQMSDDVAKQHERKLYKNVFEDSPELTPDIVDSVTEALRRLPNAKESLDEIYKAKGGLVPFYKVDRNGNMSIVRMPTLEDAEIVRRVVDETTSTAFKGGKGALGEPLGELGGKLRTQLDEFSPSLKATRQNASTIRKARDAFKMGRTAISKNVDEIAYEFEKLAKSPTQDNQAVIKAFRAGFMDSIRNATRRRPNLFQKMAQEGTQEHDMFRVIFPEQSVDEVLDKIRIAGQSQQAYQRVMFGSPTAPQQKAESLIGTGNVVSRAMAGDPTAQIEMASSLISKMRPNLNQKQKAQVVDILLSDDPNVVRKALIDDTAMAKLQQKVSQLFDIGTTTIGGVSAIQSGEQAGDIGEGLINLFGQ